jgi:3-oxoacyl-[acyl-carrier-protein] synthase-3
MHSSADPLVATPPTGAAQRFAGITGIGSALPETAVSSAEVGAPLGLAGGWIERRTGIRSRRRAAPGDRLSDLAASAATEALRQADLPAAEIDLVLVATLSQDELTPNAAPLVAYAIGAGKAGGMDIGAACNGFVSALALGTAMIEAGRARHVLVIGAEILSRYTDYTDKRTAGLFGDGAGAAVLSLGSGGHVGATVFDTDGSAAPYITADRLNGLIRMDGHETYNRAVAALENATRDVLAAAGAELADVDLFVFHQANGRILESVRESLGVSAERILDTIAEVGNTSAASIPLALAEAARAGRLWPGARVVLAAVGAGFTSGAAYVEWGL